MAVLLAIIVCLFIPANLAFADEGDLLSIASSLHNVHPQVVCNPSANTFLITWVQTPDLTKYRQSRLYASLVRAPHKATLRKVIRISRASSKKRQAPFTALAYHPQLDRFLVVWQEIADNGKSLFLTSLDNTCTIVQRSAILDRGQGTLLSPPLLAVDASSGRALTVWVELKENKVQTTAYPFDPIEPRYLLDPRYTLDSGNTRFSLPQSLLSLNDSFRLYNFFMNSNMQRIVHIDAREINPLTGPLAPPRTVTVKKVRRSLILSAAPAANAGEALVLYNQTSTELNMSILSLMLDTGDLTASEPQRLTARSVLAWEAVLLPPAADGLHRILWLDDSNGSHNLQLQAVSEQGTLLGESQIVHSTDRRISNPVCSYGPDGLRAFVIWSEDYPDGSIRLLARYLDIQ